MMVRHCHGDNIIQINIIYRKTRSKGVSMAIVGQVVITKTNCSTEIQLAFEGVQ